MCVSHHDHHYKCCCCFPLIIGVIFVAAIEVLTLVGAIQTGDVFSIVLSSILLAMFTVSFIKRNHQKVRNSLFMSYLASLVIFLVYAIIWLCTQSLAELTARTCNTINRTDDIWSSCYDDISNFIWVFIIIYLLLIVLVRGFFVRILYYYKEECRNEQAYE